MIDGFSLSLSQGTGIATYARGLAQALKSLDRRVGVLYGRPIARSAPPLLKEVCLYDVDEEKELTRLQQPIGVGTGGIEQAHGSVQKRWRGCCRNVSSSGAITAGGPGELG